MATATDPDNKDAEISAKPDNVIGIQFSLTTLAREFKISRETVQRRLMEAGVAPAGKIKGYGVYRLRDAAIAILTPGRDQDKRDPEKMDPKERLDWYRSERERIKLDEEEGRLVWAEDVRREMAQVAKATLRAMEILPDVLERDCELTPEAMAKVETVISEVRTELARQLSEDAGGLDDQG